MDGPEGRGMVDAPATPWVPARFGITQAPPAGGRRP